MITLILLPFFSLDCRYLTSNYKPEFSSNEEIGDIEELPGGARILPVTQLAGRQSSKVFRRVPTALYLLLKNLDSFLATFCQIGSISGIARVTFFFVIS